MRQGDVPAEGWTRRSVRQLASLLLAVSLIVGARTTCAEENGDPGIPAIDSVADFDRALGMWNNFAWQVRTVEDDSPPDRRGRTMKQYLEVLVFSPANDRALADVRARAVELEAAGDKAGAYATLSEATAMFRRFAGQTQVLEDYAFLQWVLDGQQQAMQAVLERLTEAERAAAQKVLESRLRSLPATLIDGPAQPEDLLGYTRAMVRATTAALSETYNTERPRFAYQALQRDIAAGISPPSRTRTATCAPPVPTPAPGESPTIDRASVTQPPYPDSARRSNFEGRIILRVEVDADGCATRATLIGPIGVPDVEAVALEWAIDQRFHPATRDGKPVAGSTDVASIFKLTD